MKLLPGLHEALRLMALNDLDYAPGTIMKRIEELEGEVVKSPYYNFSIDQLHSAISERDEQLRVALDEVRQWKESVEAVALASREVENELKVALGECVVALEHAKEIGFDRSRLRSPITRAQALLNERSK